MPWEKRKGTSKLYYTRTTQGPDSRRTRAYLGNGPLAEIAALQDALFRIERELWRRESRAAYPWAHRHAPPSPDDDTTSDLASKVAAGMEQAVEGLRSAFGISPSTPPIEAQPPASDGTAEPRFDQSKQ